MSDYFGLAYQFFNLTRESINEMDKQGNHTMIFSDPHDISEEFWETYEKQTCWNDFNVGIPILFNFYHGLELFMKALLYELYPNQKITTHKLSSLLLQLQTGTKKLPEQLLIILENHLSDKSPFYDFFKTNGLSVDSYYELLKYPESKKGQPFYFSDIRGNENLGIEKFKRIRKAIIDLKQEIIDWNKSRYPK